MKHMPMSVRVPIELDNPSIFRNEDLCIKCGQCRDVCTDYIGVHGTYDLKDTGNVAVCINCGHLVIGKIAPEICPVCKYSQSYFEVRSENY